MNKESLTLLVQAYNLLYNTKVTASGDDLMKIANAITLLQRVIQIEQSAPQEAE